MNTPKTYNAYAQLDQVKIHYLDTQTKGDTIICIHGLWGRGETWKNFMHNYAHRYRIIAPDLRGHGYSDKPNTPYTAKGMCDDIAQLMDHLNIEKAIVLGHSQGGRIAGHLAYYHSERVSKIGIFDKSADGLDPNSVIDNKAVHKDPLTHNWPLPFKTLEEARCFIIDTVDTPLSYGYFMLSLTETTQGYDMLFKQSAIGSLKANDTNWFHLLHEIKCPTLLMRSSSHEAVSDIDWNKMNTYLKNCRSVEMSHPDHNVHLANPDEFYDSIDAFIK